jgi:large subunit ribosomal protein L32e
LCNTDVNCRFYGPNGLKKFLITNETDLELLMMNNRVYTGELAKNLSARKRLRIIQRAKELNVRITNPRAKVATEERQTAL